MGVVTEAIKIEGQLLMERIHNLLNLCLSNGIIRTKWNKLNNDTSTQERRYDRLGKIQTN